MLLQRVMVNTFGGFAVSFASESGCWFLFSIQNKPERWHKATATLRRSKLLVRVSWPILRRILRRIFWWIFRQISRRIFLADFSADIPDCARTRRRISFQTFPNPVKRRTCVTFSKNQRRQSPKSAHTSPPCLWVYCCSLGAQGQARHNPQSSRFLEWLGGMPMCQC